MTCGRDGCDIEDAWQGTNVRDMIGTRDAWQGTCVIIINVCEGQNLRVCLCDLNEFYAKDFKRLDKHFSSI